MARKLGIRALSALTGIGLVAAAYAATPAAPAYAASSHKFKNVKTGTCLSVFSQQVTDGSSLVHRTCAPGYDDQVWTIGEPLGFEGTGTVWIRIGSKCIQEPYTESASIPAYVNECNINTVRQFWRVFAISGTTQYVIRNRHTGRYLYAMTDRYYVGTAAGTPYNHYKWRAYAPS